MDEKLEEIVKQEKPNREGLAKTSSDQTIKTSKISLETRIKSTLDAISFLGKTAFTGGLIAATYGLVGKSSLLTAAGNGVGYLIEKIKGKEKIKKEVLNKEVATGSILGVVGHSLYSLIDFIPNYNAPLKILKTVAFNPLMLAPYVAFYKAFTYLRDKVGTVKSALGLINLKIFKYLKDAYYNEIKPTFYESMRKVTYLMPIHFASINYVQEVWKRVGIGVFNDIVFRLFQSKKDTNKGYVKEDYTYRVPRYAA